MIGRFSFLLSHFDCFLSEHYTCTSSSFNMFLSNLQKYISFYSHSCLIPSLWNLWQPTNGVTVCQCAPLLSKIWFVSIGGVEQDMITYECKCAVFPARHMNWTPMQSSPQLCWVPLPRKTGCTRTVHIFLIDQQIPMPLPNLHPDQECKSWVLRETQWFGGYHKMCMLKSPNTEASRCSTVASAWIGCLLQSCRPKAGVLKAIDTSIFQIQWTYSSQDKYQWYSQASASGAQCTQHQILHSERWDAVEKLAEKNAEKKTLSI